MALTNSQVRFYDSNVLRLPAEDRRKYNDQVDRLVKELGRTLRDREEIRITRVVKAGSFAKHTILKQTADDPVDVDVVIYVSGQDLDREDYASLSEKIHGLLVKLYPTKNVEDFEIQRRAATVTFVGTGLSVDIVPVIEDGRREGYGWQFDRDGGRTATCAPCQIEFVRERKRRDADFRTLVRMGKRWMRHAELDGIKSFHIELIMAHVLAKNGAQGTLEQRFRDFLLYIAQSELKEKISFPENDRPAQFSDPVIILDPVCDDNNTTSRITEPERQKIVAAALSSWETAHYASARTDLDLEPWKEIFGPRFRVEARG